ncbi:MAG TPA: ATP-grasp domain-containing protein [Casimicrobiaceae bacterium]|nr:ATP-grasp domain-containing protein [Casimicrobiaceae bacterium]
MSDALLMVSTASQWLGPARMARALAKAGFTVALLAPPDSLAAKSRFVAIHQVLAANAIPMEWLQALIASIDDLAPRVLVPCDEMAIRLLFALVLGPPRDLPSATRKRLAGLIEASLGDPAHYQTSIDKTLLPPAAEALGVRVPAYVLAGGIEEAIAGAATLGYPLVVKRRFGFAGEGVAIVADADELTMHCNALLGPDQLDLEQRLPGRLLIQAFIHGAYHSQAFAAVHGRVLAAFGWDRRVATMPRKGQTSVLRFVRSPETLQFAETLCRAFGISGFCNVQFVLDGSGKAYLLEINRRIVTHMHMGERVGADLALGLAQGLHGAPARHDAQPQAADGPSVAIFPREWLRDPRSAYLRDCPADLPWDEPELLRALLAMRH